MYPTATRNPGPANASALRQRLRPGIATVRYASARLGVTRARRHPGWAGRDGGVSCALCSRSVRRVAMTGQPVSGPRGGFLAWLTNNLVHPKMQMGTYTESHRGTSHRAETGTRPERRVIALTGRFSTILTRSHGPLGARPGHRPPMSRSTASIR